MACQKLILFVLFLNYGVFTFAEHINIRKCCTETEYLNSKGLCTRASSKKDKNGFNQFKTKIFHKYDNWTKTVEHKFLSGSTSELYIEKTDVEVFYPYMKIRAASQQHDLFIYLRNATQEYCLDYNSRGRITLKYLSTYTTCENELCLPVCKIEQIIKSKNDTFRNQRMTFLVPVELSNRTTLGQEVLQNFNLQNKKLGQLDSCNGVYKRANNTKTFKIKRYNLDITFDDKMLPYGSYCLEPLNLKGNQFEIYECVEPEETFWAKYKWYVIGGIGIILAIILLPVCICMCICGTVASLCNSCCC